MSSWVIRRRATGEVLFETFNAKIVAALNASKYEAVPILAYLQALSREVARLNETHRATLQERAAKAAPRRFTGEPPTGFGSFDATTRED